MITFLNVLRVKQWTKNMFIFFPLLFSGEFFVRLLLWNCIKTFAGFCLISSSLYVLNDFLDQKADRVHPRKARRPLARGQLKPPVVALLILILQSLGLWICWEVNRAVFLTALVYIGVHLVYNFLIKRVVILDVLFIALGFHLRIWAGGMAALVIPSVWLQLCVFLLALFLGFSKRRYEMTALKHEAVEHRGVLAHYTAYLLDQIIMICCTLAIAFYGLYTIFSDVGKSPGNPYMAYSIAFVIYGIFRYLYLVHVRRLGDDPAEVLLLDMPLLICVLLWIGYVGIFLYGLR